MKENNDFRKFVRLLGCLICNSECYGSIHAHHHKHRGSGHGDIKNLVPLCAKHHYEIHGTGKIYFQNKYDLNLELIVEQIYLDFLNKKNNSLQN